MYTYTGKIHHRNHGDNIHTVTAIFYNKAQNDTFKLDERDLHDDIDVSTGDTREMYIRAMRDLQNYKLKHGIETDYTPVDEWELIDYSRLEID